MSAFGAWVSDYTPLLPGSHAQPQRISRAIFRAPGSLNGDRLQTLSGIGLGDDTTDPLASVASYDESGGVAPQDAAAYYSGDTGGSSGSGSSWLSSLLNFGSTAAQAGASIYSAVNQPGQPTIVRPIVTSGSGLSSGLMIGGVALLAILLLSRRK